MLCFAGIAGAIAAGCGNEAGGSKTATLTPGVLATGSPTTLIELPAGMFDTSALDPRSRTAFVKLMNDMLSPCGQPMTIAACLSKATDCFKCERVAKVAYRNFVEGLPEEAVLELSVDTVLALSRPACAIDIAGAPIKGPESAAITLVEFSDFECPHCKEAGPKLTELVNESGGKVKMYFKHFPLSFHEHARTAAAGAIAAGNQDKFWEFHDAVFAGQDDVGKPGFLESVAKDLGLDMDKWNADRVAPSVLERIENDRKTGDTCGVAGTPAIYINGIRFADYPDLPQLKGWIADELEAKAKGGG